MRNFVPPSYSLAVFLKAFHAVVQKGVFPYEAVRSTEDLRQTFCPQKEAFHSEFKNSDISDEDWQIKVRQVWDEQGMRSWFDFLVYYNTCDVAPFLTAVENYESKFPDVDLYKTFISLSSLAYFNGFSKAPPSDKFFKCPEKVYSLMRDNIVGGFSSASTRYFKAGQTKINTEQQKIIGQVKGFDCNAMYLHACAGDMPVGIPRIYYPKRGYLKEQAPFGTSLKAREWLEHKRINGFPDMQTAFDVGKCFHSKFVYFLNVYSILNSIFFFMFSTGEKRIGRRRFRADGYSPSTNTIFQFDGEKCENSGLW